MILDYSEYVIERATQGIVNYAVADRNTKLFQHNSICPFCCTPITNLVYSNQKEDYPEWLYGSFRQYEEVLQCPSCGWWEYKYQNMSDAIVDGIRASDIKYASAILKTYRDDSMEAPVSEVRRYLEKNPNLLYSMNPHKLEEVVRSILQDFYPSCEVQTFGQTRDGGRDGLLILEDGKHHLLQVKRRTNKDHTEGVSQLRELIGASVIEDNLSGCIYVTTADHFSHDAEVYAQKVIQKKVVETFELIDCKGFLRLLDLTKDSLSFCWKKLLTLND